MPGFGLCRLPGPRLYGLGSRVLGFDAHTHSHEAGKAPHRVWGGRCWGEVVFLFPSYLG